MDRFFFKVLGAVSLMLLPAFHLSADNSDSLMVVRPVNSFYSIEAGSSHLTDTYLTPVKYSGWHIGFDYERNQSMKFSPEKWVMQMRFGLGFDKAVIASGSQSMLNGQLNFTWSMMRRWRFAHGISAAVGGSALLRAGCLYRDRGGNNPASAKASLMVGLTGYVCWNGLVGSVPVTLRYQPFLPVTGAFFAPDYGELYYEIYLGNHSGLAHCGWWGNYFALDNLVTADFRFGSTTLRVGYSGSIYSTDINHTVTNIITHAAVVGVGGEWISVSPGKKLSDAARSISATY
ncbi:MAG: DUF3316 domain-containing protein [Paramuribaculum sp.]|nr:DUF3316 domain-containing protein [Paramuribaculum sp.]MDE6488470.1 DUF3316 domain-containing protein [Paramuribaculum sp.]